MGKTNAERQAAYREKHFKAVGGNPARLNIPLSAKAKTELHRLASVYGVTQRAVLESMLDQAELALLETLPAKERKQYYQRALSLPRNGFGVTE
jgi:hypothetical protein